MSASAFHDQAEDHFKDDNFKLAAEFYDKAVDASSSEPAATRARILANRANNSLKLKKYADALKDTEAALAIEAGNARALQRKGVALFYLDRFVEAQSAFEAAAKAGFTGDLSLWKRKCAAEIAREEAGPTAPVMAAAASGPAPVIHKIEALPKPKPKPAAKPAPVQPAAPAAPLNLAQKTREQWFQSPEEATITLLAKNVKNEQVSVELDEATATLKAKISFPADSSEFEKSWKLFAGVKAEPAINITPYKIEITLKKRSPISWDTLERKQDALPPEVEPTAASALPAEVVVPRANVYREDVNFAAYPTSNKTLKNWQDVEAEAKKAEEEEKPEGEAALQKLFQSIYGGADEVNAMTTATDRFLFSRSFQLFTLVRH